MAITIRNRLTEELIRKIGQRTGEGPSAVVRRLAEQEAVGQHNAVPEREVQRRLRRFKEFAEKYPPPEPKPSWDEIEREMDALFDYLDEDPREGQRKS